MINVIFKKLKGVHGYAYLGKNKIEINSRIKGKKLLEIMIHEILHLSLPTLNERDIEIISIDITHTLWEQSFRQVDNTNSIAMQDDSF